ncbi:hypothetical protein BDK51DRAFT_28181 [Blyttiomyces helicus]|uniref:Uncharacterized protein n=1 Tax=Blyttiomyces helicus TaxID=388810 RepID=A0A4P9WI50_9FUNG|nr:hypothetical protein BDK51DRAFT_28181 [Blyttiomyces helicus]|eukprot:RKO91118.1 hypothetical protein BDK51DRAFT_28181 [Blyttiomyces helicus]
MADDCGLQSNDRRATLEGRRDLGQNVEGGIDVEATDGSGQRLKRAQAPSGVEGQRAGPCPEDLKAHSGRWRSVKKGKELNSLNSEGGEQGSGASWLGSGRQIPGCRKLNQPNSEFISGPRHGAADALNFLLERDGPVENLNPRAPPLGATTASSSRTKGGPSVPTASSPATRLEAPTTVRRTTPSSSSRKTSRMTCGSTSRLWRLRARSRNTSSPRTKEQHTTTSS